MPAGHITDKQREILDFIKSEILKKGYPPAVREICEAVHLKSTSSVHAHQTMPQSIQLLSFS
jgi:repressor LexA